MASWPDLAVIDEKCLDEKSWEVIGRGGFGNVSKVRHRQWSRDVAIKLLGFDDGINTDRDLLRESKLMQHAESTHVTKVLGVFRGRPPAPLYGPGVQIGLVMELMERGSLTSLQKKINHPLPWSLVCRLAHQVALGMEHLHSLDPPIIHKDLKPDNVLLDTGLNVKITDFGLSKFVDKVTSSHIKEAGTIQYMPPEALISLLYISKPAFDVYSYGILLWSIMTGKVPYKDQLKEILAIVIPKGDRPPLDAINTEQAPEAKDLVKLMERCWVHEPDQRPLFPDCSAKTGALYERNKPGIEHAVDQIQTELEDQKNERTKVQEVKRADCSAKTGALYERNKPGIEHAVDQIQTELHTLHILRQTGGMGFSIVGGKGFTPYKGDDEGIFISRVSEEGPAARAGVKVGDKLLEVNAVDLNGAEHHTAVEALRSSGGTVSMTVLRERMVEPENAITTTPLRPEDDYFPRVERRSSGLPFCLEANSSPGGAPRERLTTVLVRNDKGLGFSIAGGKGSTAYRTGDTEDQKNERTKVQEVKRADCSAKTGALYERNKPGIEHAVDQIQTELHTLHILRQTGGLGFSIVGGKGFTPYKGDDEGIFISRVSEEGPAARAGVKVGDKLLEVNAVDLNGAEHHTAVEALRSSGGTVSMTVLRERMVEPENAITTTPLRPEDDYFPRVERRSSGLPFCLEANSSPGGAPRERLTTVLVRNDKGLGFSIAGGKGSTAYRTGDTEDQKNERTKVQEVKRAVMDELIDPILTIASTLHSLCEEVRANKKRCTRLKDRVKGLKQVLKDTKRKRAMQISSEMHTALKDLKLTLESATAVVKKYKADNESLIKRILNTFNPGDELESLNNRLNDAFQSLYLMQVDVDPNLHKLFDSASQREADEAARKEDCAEMQKMLKEVADQQDTVEQKLEVMSLEPAKGKADVKQVIEMLEKSEIIPKDIRTIFPEDLTYAFPKVPIRKTDISEVHKGEYRKYPVAIKRYLGSQTEASEAMWIFEREIQTMKRYESPHILQIFGVCFQGAEARIVMEYCEKGSLREVLEKPKRLDWYTKARMCSDAALGIYRLHQSEEKNKLHTNLSSDNFMVAEGYRVKLGGLELASTECCLRKTNSPRKSSIMHYRSPEQLKSVNHTYCKICEIYSLGMVLWEIATQKKPFDGCTKFIHIYTRVCEEKRVLEPLPEDCPKKLGELINACRGYDAFQRPTAGVLVDKLRQVVEQLEEE